MVPFTIEEAATAAVAVGEPKLEAIVLLAFLVGILSEMLVVSIAM